MRRLITPVLALALLVLPVTSSAVVPPKDCGRMSVNGKRYQVKADQIPCSDGRTYARRYLVNRSKPRGYRCDRFSTARNRVTFQCSSGKKVYLAIRR